MFKKSYVAAVTVLALSAGTFFLNSEPKISPVQIAGPLAQGEEENEGFATLEGEPSSKITGGNSSIVATAERGNKPLKEFKDTPGMAQRLMREMLSPKPDLVNTNVAVGQVQAASGSKVLGAIGSGFLGMSLGNGGNGYPPDTSGDIGPYNFVQAVNTAVAIFSRDGQKQRQMNFNSFMTSAGQPSSSPCGSQNYGDPIVLYDTTAQKWVVMDFAFGSTYVPSYFCVAVSQGSDAYTSPWKSFQILASKTDLADYPKMVATPSGIVISANMFKGGRTYSGAAIWVLNRDDLFGSATTLRSINWSVGNSFFSLMPVNVRFPVSNQLSSKVGGYLLSDYGLNGAMRVFQIPSPNWSATNTLSNFTFTVPGFTSYASNGGRIPQFGSTETVDSLKDRLMYAAQMIDTGSLTGKIYVSRTAQDTAGFAAIRWYEFNVSNSTSGSFTTLQGVTYSGGSGTHRWMSSIGVNNKQEVAIAYSASSPTKSEYPSIRTAGRSVANSALGVLDIAETVLKAGTGSQQGGYNRWGDYSMVSVDPFDKCTFWATTEFYASTGNNWQTWIQPFKLTTCP